MDKVSEIAQKLIKYAQEKDFYIILRFQNYKSRTMSVKNGKVDTSSITEIRGTGIHTFTKTGHTGFASVDTLQDKKRIFATLKTAMNAAKTAQKNKFEAIKQVFDLKPHKDKIYQKVPKDPFKVTNKKLEKDLLSFNEKLKKQNKKFSVTNNVKFEKDHRRIIRSDGTNVEFRVDNSLLYSTITINIKNNKNEVFEKTSGRGYEILEDKKSLSFHKKKLDNKLKHIKNYAKAKNIQPGNYALLLDGSIAGVFTHEAFGHTAESDNTYQKSPLLKNGKIDKGKSIAKDYVNIIDYAKENDWGFTPYSDFGIKRQKAFIVKDGKINNLLSDMLTARKANARLTGAARAGFYLNIPIPRMSNTQIIVDKKHTIPLAFNHLIADIKKIHNILKRNKVFSKYPELIYLMGSSGGMVDSYEGNFQFASIVSFKLTCQKIELLKPVSFSGVTLEALKSIDLALGDPVGLPGFCGKAGQWVNVYSRAPMLLLAQNKFVTIG